MRERDYVKLIPEAEMRPIQALLARIYEARGFSYSNKAAMQERWARVVAAATLDLAHGADFDPLGMQPQQLQQLCALVDQHFLGGLLAQQVARAKRPPLRLVLGRDARNPHGWLSGLHPDNTIYVNADSPRWSADAGVTETAPLEFEGTLCSSRLEALAHTIGHELAHAVVLNFFPKVDAASPAYLPDDRHGPIFQLLNKRLFGHTMCAADVRQVVAGVL